MKLEFEFEPLTPAALHCGILLCLEEGIEINIPHGITEENFSVIFNKFSRKFGELEPNYSREDLYFKVFLGRGSFIVATNHEDERQSREDGYEELRYAFSFSTDFMELNVTLNVDEEESIPTERTFSRLRSGTNTKTMEKVFAFSSVLPFLTFGESFFWKDVRDSRWANSLIEATKVAFAE